MIANIYIVAFLILYFLIVFITPSIRVKRKTGINPYVFKNTDSAHDFLGKVSAPITSLIFIVALVNLFYPRRFAVFRTLYMARNINSEIYRFRIHSPCTFMDYRSASTNE